MCGVFGCIGSASDAASATVTALKTLEYRGYDSWGVALATGDGVIVEKRAGRIGGSPWALPAATVALGHTRWATHGGVTAVNAHPHLDCSGRIVVVHNGIVENHAALRAELRQVGHQFQSETDSEVIAHLVEEEIAVDPSFARAVASAFQRLEGYNAIVVLDSLERCFAAAKRVSPLVIGLGDEKTTIASDAIALGIHADRLIYLEDDQLATIDAHGVDLFDIESLLPLESVETVATATPSEIALGGYPDFMSKEIAEQPKALRRLLLEASKEIQQLARLIAESPQTMFLGCGTAANAALAATYIFSDVCGLDVAAMPASEFRYRAAALRPDTLLVALSQSGETIDLIEAMRAARTCGAGLTAILNVANSSLDRMVPTRVLLRAGPEQCVLSTKAYTTKLATLLLTAHAIAGTWDCGVAAVLKAADAVESLLHGPVPGQLRALATSFSGVEHLFVIGRGVHFASSLEAALKIKEVSYIHAEGFAGGELKHGVIALVSEGTPCLVFAPADGTRADILSGAAELSSRGGRIIGVGAESDSVFDEFVQIPDGGVASPIVEAIPGQLLGYFAALAKGNDPDRPRNLAKSVTVK